jgi:hypothetical protein
MGHKPSDDVKVPAGYRPLLRRLQRGLWSETELRWLLASDPKLPLIVSSVVREKLAALAAAANTGL